MGEKRPQAYPLIAHKWAPTLRRGPAPRRPSPVEGWMLNVLSVAPSARTVAAGQILPPVGRRAANQRPGVFKIMTLYVVRNVALALLNLPE